MDPINQLQTLILDISQRLAALEMGSRFADEQRQALLKMLNKLSDRLEPLRDLVGGMKSVETRVNTLEVTSSEHEELIHKAAGAMLFGKAIGLIILAMCSGIVVLLVKIYLRV